MTFRHLSLRAKRLYGKRACGTKELSNQARLRVCPCREEETCITAPSRGPLLRTTL